MRTLNDTMDCFQLFTELLFTKSFLDERNELIKSDKHDIDPIR